MKKGNLMYLTGAKKSYLTSSQICMPKPVLNTNLVEQCRNSETIPLCTKSDTNQPCTDNDIKSLSTNNQTLCQAYVLEKRSWGHLVCFLRN